MAGGRSSYDSRRPGLHRRAGAGGGSGPPPPGKQQEKIRIRRREAWEEVGGCMVWLAWCPPTTPHLLTLHRSLSPFTERREVGGGEELLTILTQAPSRSLPPIFAPAQSHPALGVGFGVRRALAYAGVSLVSSGSARFCGTGAPSGEVLLVRVPLRPRYTSGWSRLQIP